MKIPALTTQAELDHAISLAYGNIRTVAERERSRTITCLFRQWREGLDGQNSPMSQSANEKLAQTCH